MLRASAPSPSASALRRPAAGFTLIEVLVAIIVLSFGMLGAVGLQAAALQANKEARYQSAAARLGRELVDLMRGNVSVSSQTTTAANPYLATTATLPYTTSANCYVTSCASAGVAEIAKFQMNDWFARLNNDLPNPRIVVCFDGSPYTAGVPHWSCDNSGNVVVVKIGWTHQSLNRTATGASALLLASDDTVAPNVVIPMAATP